MEQKWEPVADEQSQCFIGMYIGIVHYTTTLGKQVF